MQGKKNGFQIVASSHFSREENSNWRNWHKTKVFTVLGERSHRVLPYLKNLFILLFFWSISAPEIKKKNGLFHGETVHVLDI